MMFKENDPPVVEPSGEGVKIRIKDQLTRRRELEAEADLVVLVTGMVPRDDNRQVAEKLKIPVGTDKFYNEIHPKLRPVETVIDGVFLGGCCQGPRNVQESVSSALAASAKIHAVIRKGSIELEPVVARVNEDSCTWCGKCEEVCEYDAIFKMERNGKVVASVNEAVCKGCGICAPVCPADAIDIARYTNNEIESMIDGFAETVELTERAEGEVKEEPSVAGMKELPALWKSILARIEQESSTIPQIAADLNEDAGLITWNLMTMHKYHLVEADGIDDNDEYYLYKPKNR
jgi:heterodisulfide reductase subunit A